MLSFPFEALGTEEGPSPHAAGLPTVIRLGRRGTVLSFPFEALGTDEGPSPHAAGLPTVIRLGRQSGVPLPSWIHIVAIEADDMESFVEGLTPAVEAAVPEAVAVIRSVLADAPAPASAPA